MPYPVYTPNVGLSGDFVTELFNRREMDQYQLREDDQSWYDIMAQEICANAGTGNWRKIAHALEGIAMELEIIG